jgi:hypothetical protein
VGHRDRHPQAQGVLLPVEFWAWSLLLLQWLWHEEGLTKLLKMFMIKRSDGF